MLRVLSGHTWAPRISLTIKKRWCLWLKDATPRELRDMPEVMARVERVRDFRAKSSAEPTRKTADTPSLFFYISQPATDYLVIPEVSYERRQFIPIGYASKKVICSNTNYLIPEANLYVLGMLCSTMHMAWVRHVCGRLKSDYRYTGSMVYNNYPWPSDPTKKQKAAVEEAAQGVLDARAAHPDASLADLYDPVAMPPDLRKAHQALDKAVDAAYGKKTFTSDAERVAFLFELYHKYTSLLPAPVSTSMFWLPVRMRSEFMPQTYRFRWSTSILFDHNDLGMTPNMVPASRTYVPSDRTVSS